jgi:hypothetical protein
MGRLQFGRYSNIVFFINNDGGIDLSRLEPDPSMTHQQTVTLKQWLILAVLLLGLIALESFALYTVFTSKVGGGNDFFVRWLGGREYLLHGTNPFDASVAEKAQMAMFGRLTTPQDKDEAYFAYPLYTFYFFLPLSLLPYPWARAIWMTLLQLMLMGITVLSIRLSGWRPPRWLFWLTLLWGIFFYHGARAIILGQFSILVGLALLAALWSIQQRRDVWAGVFLAVTTIKPQMVFLVLVFLLIWALFHKRFTLIMSFGASVLLLVASSMLLVPTWPLDFVRNAIAYTDYVAFGTPLENLLYYFFPASFADPLTLILSIIFFLTLLPGWWLAWRGRAGAYTWAVMTTLIVGSLITFRSATANQIILYLPLFFFFHRLTIFTALAGKRVNMVIVAIEIALMGSMWAVFLALLEGNWEHVMMHGLLPALMLLLYALDWRALWQTAQEAT